MSRAFDLPSRSLLAIIVACAALLTAVGLASNAAPISVAKEPGRAASIGQTDAQPDRVNLPEAVGVGEPINIPPFVGIAVTIVACLIFARGVLLLLQPHIRRWRLFGWARRGNVDVSQQPHEDADIDAERLASAAAQMRRGLLGGDARLAVQRCYALVESGFGDDDLARGAAETPLQYLERLFGAVDPGIDRALRRLTALFERARFSDQEVTEAMRDDASLALEEVEGFYRDAAQGQLVET